MFKTIRSKMLFLVIFLMLLTAGSVVLTTKVIINKEIWRIHQEFRDEAQKIALRTIENAWHRQDASDPDAHKNSVIQEIEYIFQNDRVDESGCVFVFDAKGKILIHPQLKGLDLSVISDGMSGKSIFQTLSRSVVTPNQPITFSLNIPGQNQQVQTAYVQYFKPAHWYVAASFYNTIIYSIVTRLIIKESVIILAILVVGILIAVLLSDKLSQHLFMLADYARRLPHQDLTQASESFLFFQPSFFLDNEVKKLSDAFVFMENQLRKYINYLKITQDNLEHLVEARTAELYAANLNLKKAFEEKQLILNNVNHHICYQDTDHRFVWISRAMCESFHLNPDEVIGKTCYEVLRKLSKPCEKCPIRIARETGQPYQSEMQSRTGRTWLVSGNPVKDSSGNVVGVIEVTYEISDRKRMEEELRQAKEAAEDANRSKSEFLANMSHELRTPLNAILGFAQILEKDDSLSEFAKDRVRLIHQSGDHLLMLINDILDMSKIEAGKMALVKKDFDLSAFLNVIVNLIRPKAEAKGLYFRYTASLDLPVYICADEVRLRQVLLNLLSNAVKYTENGGVTFKVYSNQGKIGFIVEDTGIGISPEKIEKIFLPFYRVDDNRIYTDGSGLGLSISQRLLQLMGSELQVNSSLDKGSTFRFELEVPEAAETTLYSSKDSGNRIIGYEGEPRRILIADDLESNRNVLADILTPLQFEIREASNGEQAVKMIAEFNPHLVLLDLFMPNTDGFEVIRRMRNASDLPIIIGVSANVLKPIIEQCADAGCNDFIPKPVDAQELLNKIQFHLNLNWVYESVKTNEEPLVLPPPEIIQSFYSMAVIGDIGGILNQAQELIRSRPEFESFANRLYQMAKAFQTTQIKMFIEAINKGAAA